MSEKVKIILLLIFLALVSPAAHADERTDEATKKVMQAARDNITKAKLSDGSNIAAETTEELKQDIVPFAQAKKTVAVGVLSGIAQWCSIDWSKFFASYMAYERNKNQWSEKQLAYIGMMHGLAQGMIVNSYQGRTCSAKETVMIRDKIKETKF
jgi:hypothetical protein